jgi:hypothetical protein
LGRKATKESEEVRKRKRFSKAKNTNKGTMSLEGRGIYTKNPWDMWQEDHHIPGSAMIVTSGGEAMRKI